MCRYQLPTRLRHRLFSSWLDYPLRHSDEQQPPMLYVSTSSQLHHQTQSFKLTFPELVVSVFARAFVSTTIVSPSRAIFPVRPPFPALLTTASCYINKSPICRVQQIVVAPNMRNTLNNVNVTVVRKNSQTVHLSTAEPCISANRAPHPCKPD